MSFTIVDAAGAGHTQLMGPSDLGVMPLDLVHYLANTGCDPVVFINFFTSGNCEGARGGRAGPAPSRRQGELPAPRTNRRPVPAAAADTRVPLAPTMAQMGDAVVTGAWHGVHAVVACPLPAQRLPPTFAPCLARACALPPFSHSCRRVRPARRHSHQGGAAHLQTD